MKKILAYFLAISMISVSIYFLCLTEHVGNVIGEINTEYYHNEKTKAENVIITFDYEDFKGNKYSQRLDEEKYYLDNTDYGRHLKEGKVYDHPTWALLLGAPLLFISLMFFLQLCISWGCYRSKYSKNTTIAQMRATSYDCSGC